MGMARVCDVFGVVKDVKTVRILIADKNEDLLQCEADLSPRAIDRLLKKVNDGMCPPPSRKVNDD